MINGYKVMDAHCHVYPAAIAAKAVGGTDAFYGVVSAHDGTVETLMEKEMAIGVDHCVIQSVATTPKQVGSINEFIARTVAAGEGRFIGLGTLHPDSPDQAADVAHLVELGLKGVKLHPDIQGFQLDDPRCLKIYDLCRQYRLPVLLHTGDDRYDNSNPNRLLPVLEAYPDLIFIGAILHFNTGSTLLDRMVLLAHQLEASRESTAALNNLGSNRWFLWRLGVKYALEKPLFGYGPENLGHLYYTISPDLSDRPHNELIQIAASLGIPALGFYLVGLGSLLHGLLCLLHHCLPSRRAPMLTTKGGNKT